ncbi:MAG: hypothetical protein R3B47_05400 [Bacteroidia bacterium]
MGEIAGLSERLALYVRSQSYREEPELRTAYSILSRCHVLFHDFGSIKDGLYYELNKLYRNFENPSSLNPYMLSTRSLMRVIVPMRSIVAGLKQDKPQRVSNNVPRLESAIGRAENEMEGILATLDPVRQEKARAQYFYFTEVSGDFLAASKEYLASDAFDEAYADYGKSYYYHNHRLLDIFNDYGEGLGRRYNALVEDANIILLKTVEETLVYGAAARSATQRHGDRGRTGSSYSACSPQGGPARSAEPGGCASQQPGVFARCVKVHGTARPAAHAEVVDEKNAGIHASPGPRGGCDLFR